MHEVGIVTQIVETVQATLKDYSNVLVRDVFIKVGQLRALEPQVTIFCWDTLCRGTLVEGARLHIEDIPARGFCRTCQREFDADNLVFICPDCGGYQVDTVQGNELLVERILFEEQETLSGVVS